jgi:hypothetical protein
MKTLVTAVASALLACSAYAQSPAPGGDTAPMADNPPSAMKKSDAKRDMVVEQHIKDLHGKLKITAAEESQWATVAQTMRDNATELDQAIDKRQAMVGKATAIDNLDAYGDIAQAHLDSVKKLSAAFAPLYASMADDQKKVADDVFGHRDNRKEKTSRQ